MWCTFFKLVPLLAQKTTIWLHLVYLTRMYALFGPEQCGVASKLTNIRYCTLCFLVCIQLDQQRGIPTASEYFYYERKVVGTNCPPSMPEKHEVLSELQRICKWFIILKVLSVLSLNPEIPERVFSYKGSTQASHQKMTRNKNDFLLRHHLLAPYVLQQSKQFQAGWQKLEAFRRGQKSIKNVRQVRVYYFRDKCVVFACNCKFTNLFLFGILYPLCTLPILAVETGKAMYAVYEMLAVYMGRC